MKSTMTTSWITEDLAVGDIEDMKHHDALREMGIDVVIDVRCHFEETARMYPHDTVWWCAEAVDCLINHGYKVALFCEAGQERSPFVAMLVLYLSGEWKLDMGKAYEEVVRKRPQTLVQMEWCNHLLEEHD